MTNLKRVFIVEKIVQSAEKEHTTIKRLVVAKASLSIGLVTMCISQHPAALAVGITANMAWLWLL